MVSIRPPTRVDVFSIAIQTLSLGLLVVFQLLGRLADVQGKDMEWTTRLLEHTFGPDHDSGKARPECDALDCLMDYLTTRSPGAGRGCPHDIS